MTALADGILTHPANRALRRRLGAGTLDVEGFHRQLVHLALRQLLPTPDGSRLPCPDLERCQIDPDHLVRARAALDTGGELGARQLGDLYEGLLDREPTLDLAARRYELHLAPARRRAAGRFYTPGPVVDRLVALVVDPLLEEAERAARPDEAILAVTVLDPACGPGHFLVAVAARLADRLARARASGATPTPDQHRAALVEVTTRCTHGIDIDPTAVELARAALWLAATGSRLPPDPALDHHLVWGDALVGATRARVAAGVPDAAFAPVADDDRAVARRLRRANAAERRGGPPAPAGPGLAAERADAWCAAFLQPKRGEGPFVTTAALRRASRLAPLRAQVRACLAGRPPVHPDLAFPDLDGGFAAVVGNPPFLGRLREATALAPRTANLLRHLLGQPVGPYADVAALFLLLAVDLLRPGGRLGLVQPLSVLTARDAAAVRRRLAETTTVEALWVSRRAAFGANVATCALVLTDGAAPTHPVRRLEGPHLEPVPPRPHGRHELARLPTWAPLASEGAGVPVVHLHQDGTLADLCTATADFRDQYYGVAPFVHDAGGGPVPPGHAPLITVGTVDPLRSWWGERPTRFHKVDHHAPVVDLVALEAGSALGPWARSRLTPKLVLATQTRVLEVVVDEEGAYLPSVPLVTITAAGPEARWRAAAVLLSPPVAAWAARHHLGAGMSAGVIKLSAGQVLDLPTPARARPWDQAVEAFRAAHEEGRAGREEGWLAHLVEGATRMCEAYGQADPDLLAWWSDRLPRWR